MIFQITFDIWKLYIVTWLFRLNKDTQAFLHMKDLKKYNLSEAELKEHLEWNQL